MATKASVCCNCGTRITGGLSYPYNGKALCYSCYKKIQSSLLSTESDRSELYQYIRTLFSLADIPAEVVSAIDKEATRGKSYKDIRFVIYYYYEILCNQCGSIDVLAFVVRDYYDRAIAYRAQASLIKEKNESVDLSAQPVRTIVLTPEDLRSPTNRKPKKYDISDL